MKSPKLVNQVGYADEPLTIGLKTNSRYEVYDKDTVLFVQDSKAKWSTLDTTYDKRNGMMMFDTADIGTYSLYVEDHSTNVSGNQNPSHWSESYRVDVYSQITVSGLSNYNPEADMSESEMIQAVYGTAMSATTIDLSIR